MQKMLQSTILFIAFALATPVFAFSIVWDRIPDCNGYRVYGAADQRLLKKTSEYLISDLSGSTNTSIDLDDGSYVGYTFGVTAYYDEGESDMAYVQRGVSELIKVVFPKSKIDRSANGLQIIRSSGGVSIK